MFAKFCNWSRVVDFLRTFLKLFHNFPKTFSKLSQNFLTTFSQLSHKFHTTFSQLYHKCLNIMQLFDGLPLSWHTYNFLNRPWFVPLWCLFYSVSIIFHVLGASLLWACLLWIRDCSHIMSAKNGGVTLTRGCIKVLGGVPIVLCLFGDPL